MLKNSDALFLKTPQSPTPERCIFTESDLKLFDNVLTSAYAQLQWLDQDCFYAPWPDGIRQHLAKAIIYAAAHGERNRKNLLRFAMDDARRTWHASGASRK